MLSLISGNASILSRLLSTSSIEVSEAVEKSFLFPTSSSSGICRQTKNSKIFSIPEILERIVNYIDYSDLSAASQVCKSWYVLATPRLLRHVCFHGLDSFHNVVKFVQSMDWDASKLSFLDSSLYSSGDKIRLAGLFLHRAMGRVKTQGLKSSKDSLDHLKNLLIYQKRKSGVGVCCKICVHSRVLADKSPVKEMLVPVGLGKHSHRFKGAAYGVVSLKSTKKFKDQPAVKALEKVTPCLQVHIHPFRSDWNVTKSRLNHTNGPFLRSLTFSSVDVTDQVLALILGKTKNLSFLCISSCPLITDKTVEVASVTSGTRLTHITLANLPRISDSGIQSLARNCSNLEGVDLTNSTNVSEIGTKDLLSMCPFLALLDLQRLGSGAGYAINDRFIPYVVAYGISLKYLCLAGCALRGQDIEKLIASMPSVTTWGLGFSQVGSRNLHQIKAITSAWMKTECISAAQLEDYAITLTFRNNHKIHIVGSADEKISRVFQI